MFELEFGNSHQYILDAPVYLYWKYTDLAFDEIISTFADPDRDSAASLTSGSTSLPTEQGVTCVEPCAKQPPRSRGRDFLRRVYLIPNHNNHGQITTEV